jgi:hypothetical protein
MSAALTAPSAATVTREVPVRKVVLVYKSHLDVGFTEMAAKVTHDAIRWLLGEAAAQAEALRAEGGPRKFVWTVPAWIAHEALEILDGAALASVERALAAGDIAWHALPFTTHTELMDEALCEAACAISRRLDRRFGVTTRAAKLTDVPGHTLGLVTVLARCGIDFLHVGVNGMSPSPAVPPLFRWRDGLGNEVVTAYEPGYAGEVRIPGDDRLLRWCFVGDNMEVPSLADIRAAHAAAVSAYPGAEVAAGRLDDWSEGIRARAAALPAVEHELGDSWIHGSGSDPWKTVRFRELMRLRTSWLADGRLERDGAEDAGFSKQLLLLAEHTWGLSFSAHTHHDREQWDNERFARWRRRGCVRAAEASWQEQRDYLELAVGALAPSRRAEAQSALAGLAASPSPATAWQDVDAAEAIRVPGWTVRLDVATGAIASLIDAGGRERVAPGGRLAWLRYRTFDDADCRRFVAQYCTASGEWLVEEFAKLGLRGSAAVSRWWDARLVEARRRDSAEATELALELRFAEEASRLAGAPRRAELRLRLPRHRRALEARVSWEGKPATRLPESLWWSFQPQVAEPERWRLEKLGRLVDPRAVASRGGRPLHGVGRGALHDDGTEQLALLTPDAHLVAPGRPQPYEFTDEQPDLAGGLHLNLFNNLWGTNFPMWCEDDLAFRAALVWQESGGGAGLPAWTPPRW